MLSWTGGGPARIILGAGHDQVAFAAGYKPVEIDLGAGRNRVEIQAFEPGSRVSIVGADLATGNQLTIRESVAKAIGLTAAGVTADNGGSFAFDLAGFRKLSLHDADADVSLDFAGIAPERLHVSARTAAVVSRLEGKDLRLIGAEGVAVNADIFAAIGGSVAMSTTALGAAVRLGESMAASITAARGNVAIDGAGLVIGDLATTPFTITGGGLDNDAAATTVPAGRALVRSTLLGPGGDYSGMYLAGRNLSGVDLTGANLTGANLAGTNLTGARLSGAVLTGVNLAGANLTGARLLDAVFSGITGEPAALPRGWAVTAGAVIFTGIDVPAGQFEFLGGHRSGSYQIVKSGDGTLFLTRANSHSGGTFVEAGTLYVVHRDGLGSGPLVIAADANVTLDFGLRTIDMERVTLADGAELIMITAEGETTYSSASASVAENADPSTVIYTGLNPEGMTAVSWSLKQGLDDDASLVTIDEVSGAVRLVTAADFEAKPHYRFTVVAAEAGVGTVETQVLLQVTNVNETPTVGTVPLFRVTRGEAVDLVWPATPTAFADPESDPLTVTLTVAAGEIIAASTVAITVGGTNTTRTFLGIPTALNEFFGTLGNIRYAPAATGDTDIELQITVFDGEYLDDSTGDILVAEQLIQRPQLLRSTTIRVGGLGMGPAPVVISPADLSQAVVSDPASVSFVVTAVSSGRVEKWDGQTWVDVSTPPAGGSPQELLRMLALRIIGAGDQIRWVPPVRSGGGNTVNAFRILGWDGSLSAANDTDVTLEFPSS